ncbi:MAG: metal-dependent hydrolase [Verrucomicrobiota bacterium]
MDLLTHAALGASLGELLLGKKIGNRALAWGAAVALVPDLDVLLSPFLSHSNNLWWHRGPSHSLIIAALVSWWISKPLAGLWKRDKITRKLAGWFVFTVWLSHILLDCFTVYGTSLLWPFPQRNAFNNFFIIDPLFVGILLAGVLWMVFLRGKKQLPKRRRINAWTLGLSAAYLALSFGMKTIASRGFEHDLARKGITPQRRIEAPTPFNIFLWRSIAENDDGILVGHRSVFDRKDMPIRWLHIPRGRESVSGLKDHKTFRRIDWFSDGWWIARPHANGVWIADVRFGEMLEWDDRKKSVDLQFPFAWEILPGHKEPLRRLRISRRDAGEQMKRLMWRVCGKTDTWISGIPRLKGITGQLPETLRAID